MVYVLLGNGFEETEAVAPMDLMIRAGIPVTSVGIGGKIIPSSRNIRIEADITLDQLDVQDAELIMLPGGLGGVASIKASEKALQAVMDCWNAGKFVAAICAGPTILAQLHITDGKQATCYPGCESQMGSARMVADQAAVRDGKVITGTSAGCAIPFGLALIEALRGREAADTVAKQIVIR